MDIDLDLEVDEQNKEDLTIGLEELKLDNSREGTEDYFIVFIDLVIGKIIGSGGLVLFFTV